ncbi:MAG: MazG family protein [Actinomycetota bacterium]
MSSTLHLVGMGPGSPELLSLRAWELLASGKPLRIADTTHEVAQTVMARGFRFELIYEADPEWLAQSLVSWASSKDAAVYAVPGSPLEAPETVPILQEAERAGVEIDLVPSLSDLERLPAADPLTRAYGGPESVRAGLAFARLVSVMARLRSPEGCPWDRRQTHSSLAIHLLEEAHEALDAIDRGDMVDLEEELGDLLLQVVFHAQVAREDGRFSVSEVVEEHLEKLVERHPHVFGELVVSGAQEVVANWEALKHETKRRVSTSEDIPKNLPALLLAHKVQRRLAGAGAEVTASAGRIAELAVLADRPAGQPVQEVVIGELLFETVALAQRAGVDPEGALRRQCAAEAAKVRGRGAVPGR